jgi:glycine/D-amino acid oxidase-like deaminating enzyme
MTPELPPFLGRSWWLLDALDADPGVRCPPLEEDIEADVLIVGGGYTGLWTAHRLLELDPGIDVVLLERDICGGGPSGRNGGFCGGLWDLEALSELFGDARAVELLEASLDSVAEIGAWCARQGVDAWYTRGGDLGLATSPAQAGLWQGWLDTVRRLGLGDRVEELSPAEAAARIRLPYAAGGVFTASEATVQPARLARGLRRVVLEQGARIFESTAVTRLEAGPPVRAGTLSGSVRASTAVLAGGAWLASLPAFRRRLTVRGSYIVLSAPAPERLAAIGWTGGEALWNHRASVNYLRTTPDGRIAFGTGGMQPGLARRIGPRFEWDARFVATVARQFRALFPSFANVPLEAAWGGPIDVSGAHLPFVTHLPPGNVLCAAGYTGNGVGPAQLAGTILARLALDIDDELTRLPIVGFEPRRLPPEPIRSLGALAANEAILRKDAAEDDGGRPGRLTDAVARLPRRLGYNLGP